MCRSIRSLRYPDDAATTGEVEAAARQFVRKVSGYPKPSARNQAAFDAAIAEIAAAAEKLLLAVGSDVQPGPDRKPLRPSLHHHHDHEQAGAASA